MAAVAVERKLRHCENRSAHVLDRKVHLACLVLKNTQTDNLVNYILQVLLCIALGHAKKDQKALADLPCNLALDCHRSVVYKLYHCSHLFLPPAFAVETRRSTL